MVKWQEEVDATGVWKLYKNALTHPARIDLDEKISRCIDYFEGRQWAPPTESTKNLPRPVINVVKMVCRSKKASILSTPLRIIYKSYTQGIDISKLNSFANGLLIELGQNRLDRLALDDAIKKGSCFFHYYWDPNAISLNGKVDGSVRAEIIDPLNIFFENPSQLDEQKQKWIIISSSIDAESVLLQADADASLDLINQDADENGMVTVLTRYFKINNEVYFEKSTKSCIFSKAKRLSPSFLSSHAHLYPVVCGYYERKEGSIYGISEVEGLIPNQRAINFNVAMSLLNAQECAWGKYIALPGALKGQKISNVPGQVLIDHTGTGDGIKKLSGQGIDSTPMGISDSLISITRSISGANELLSGETLSANLSGTAIAQLQAQAQLPIEDLKSEFIEIKRKQGLVLAEFMRLYFYNKDFILSKSIDGKKREVFDTFNSSEFEKSVLDVTVEVTNSTRATVASDISFLNTCLENGSISLKTYIEAYPDCAISNKSDLLARLNEQEESQIEKLRAENDELRKRLGSF